MGNFPAGKNGEREKYKEAQMTPRNNLVPPALHYFSETNIEGLFSGRIEENLKGDSQMNNKYIHRTPLQNKAALLMTNNKGHMGVLDEVSHKKEQTQMYIKKARKYAKLVSKAMLLNVIKNRQESEYDTQLHRTATPKQMLVERKAREVMSPRTMLRALECSNLRALLDDRYQRNVGLG